MINLFNWIFIVASSCTLLFYVIDLIRIHIIAKNAESLVRIKGVSWISVTFLIFSVGKILFGFNELKFYESYQEYERVFGNITIDYAKDAAVYFNNAMTDFCMAMALIGLAIRWLDYNFIINGGLLIKGSLIKWDNIVDCGRKKNYINVIRIRYYNTHKRDDSMEKLITTDVNISKHQVEEIENIFKHHIGEKFLNQSDSEIIKSTF